MLVWMVGCGGAAAPDATDATSEEGEPLSERDRLKLRAKERRAHCDELAEVIGAADVRTQLVSINNASGLKKAADQLEAHGRDVEAIAVDDEGVKAAVGDYLGVLREQAAVLMGGTDDTGDALKATMKRFDALEEERGEAVDRMTEACNAPLTAP